MTLHDGIEASCYRHAATYVRGKRVVDLSPSTRPSVMEILIESGARKGFSLVQTPSCLRAYVRKTVTAGAYAPDMHAVVGRIEESPFRESTFDVVVAFFLFTRGCRDARLTEVLKRMLGHRGTLITAVPNSRWKGLSFFPEAAPMDTHELSVVLGQSFSKVSVVGQQPRQSNPLLVRKPRAASRLVPLELKDSLSRLFWNRPYFPGEYDFRFTSSVEDSPVLLGIARD